MKTEPTKAKQNPVSLYPAHRNWAIRRAKQGHISLSRYIQILIEWDAEHNVLPQAIADQFKAKN